jgi:hypothetical protein
MFMQKTGWIQKIVSKHRLFVVGVFIFAGIAHTPYLAPGGPSACYPNPLFMVADEGTVLYDSFRITCGEVIYRDFFQFQGPVFYYIHAGLFAITGPSITAARALNLLVTALTATLIALIVARSLGALAGVGAAAIHACLLLPMYPYAYPHWLAEFFSLAGIYIIIISHGRPGLELAGGACLGLSVITVQSLGLPILASCLVVLFLPGVAQRRWKETCVHPLLVSGGVLLAISPFIIYLVVTGAFDQMWYSTVEWVLKHYSEGQKDAVRQGYGAYLNTFLFLHRKVSQPWRSLAITCLRFIKLLPIFVICGAIVAMVQAIINGWRQSVDYGNLMIGTAALAGTAPLLLGIIRVDMVHIAFLGSFGICGAAIALQLIVTYKPRFHLPVAMLWIFVGMLIIVNFSAKTVMTYRLSREKKDWKGEILKGGMASWIDNNLGPNERIVTANGGLQYLYIRHAAVGFTFLPLDTPKYYSDEQWRKIGGQILKNLPAFIEVTRGQWLQMIQRTPELGQIYQLVNNRFLLR